MTAPAIRSAARRLRPHRWIRRSIRCSEVVYRYASDGKTLEDHTAEYLNADKVYSGDPMIAVAGGKVSLLFSGKYLDKGTTGWNWYRDMDRREYIAFDLELSELAGETPIRLFNRNILMTNCAFYEIVYASEPLDDSDAKAQLARTARCLPTILLRSISTAM